MTNPNITAMQINTALITGRFTEMTEHDLEGFAGVEGTGYMWDVSEGSDCDLIVIADLTETGIVVQIMDAFTGDYWNLNLATGEID